MVSPSSPRIKKHSRSRTGCFTCRKRRIKCDEQKPTCGRCEKGGRECTYPSPPSESAASQKEVESETVAKAEITTTVSSTESTPDFDLSDPDSGYPWNQPTIVKFSSSSSHLSQSPESQPEFHNPQFTQPYTSPSIPSLPSHSDSRSPQTPTYTTYPTPAATTNIIQYESPRQHSPPVTQSSSENTCVPRPISPRPEETHSVQYFLAFHRENINEYHYFLYSDYARLCTQILFAMADKSTALRHAMVSFSTLIYSIKEDPSSLHYTFVHYEKAVQELRSFLVKDPKEMDRVESETAVATALLLTTWERFFGDTLKSFLHLKGAYRILLMTTTPAQISSTLVGRALLEWYIHNEDVCCLIGAYRTMLPISWREEAIRVRRGIAQAEEQRSPRADHTARRLDDAFAEFHMKGPQISNVVYRISQLQSLPEQEAYEEISNIERDLRQFDLDIIDFSQSRRIQELMRPASPQYFVPNYHSTCCPPSPFPPYRLQNPASGYLQLSWMSYLCFTRFHLYPALRLPSSPDVEPDGEDAPFWAEEICKTFAGLEEGLGENDACMLPCASALLQAALCVPANQNSRFWIRYKLGHLERAGLIAVRKVKEALAGLWNMPDIVTEGFYPMASPPHILKLRDLDEEDLLKEMEGVDLKGKGVDSRPGSRDGSLQGLKEMRGLFELRR